MIFEIDPGVDLLAELKDVTIVKLFEATVGSKMLKVLCLQLTMQCICILQTQMN